MKFERNQFDDSRIVMLGISPTLPKSPKPNVYLDPSAVQVENHDRDVSLSLSPSLAYLSILASAVGRTKMLRSAGISGNNGFTTWKKILNAFKESLAGGREREREGRHSRSHAAVAVVTCDGGDSSGASGGT